MKLKRIKMNFLKELADNNDTEHLELKEEKFEE